MGTDAWVLHLDAGVAVGVLKGLTVPRFKPSTGEHFTLPDNADPLHGQGAAKKYRISVVSLQRNSRDSGSTL
jgi:hypothetical protein